jgi:DNA-binding winged helix-turn-helix (wHTH) protein
MERIPALKEGFRFGVFEVDLEGGELRKSGLKVPIQDQPFQVLTLLLARPGKVVTREEVREKLWPLDTFVEVDRSLNTAVAKLREALGDSADNPRFVETIPRRGYRFLHRCSGWVKLSRLSWPRAAEVPQRHHGILVAPQGSVSWRELWRWRSASSSGNDLRPRKLLQTCRFENGCWRRPIPSTSVPQLFHLAGAASLT